ncbi:zinc-dependent metalloprotease [Enterovibrio makurazakiensis]|uniref:zinc-dependent metalloprotease n=1 Tax=Enterovibrio makurazakiensis TaxID=2910232 RepID=UPI003D23A8EB
MKLNRLILSASIAAILAGCGADNQEYQTLDSRSDKEIAVSNIKEGRWLYVPTTGAAPRFALSQFPFLQGIPKLVELCFSETGLELREYDKNYPDRSLIKDESGFCNVAGQNVNDDNTNFPAVLKIPGEFAAYRCKEDAYGDCTNTEEEITDGDFSVKNSTHFTPEFVDAETIDINYVELFGIKDGLTEVGTPELIHWEFDPENGVINFELERTFTVDLDALSGHINFSTKAGTDDIFRDGGFKSRFFYSLVHEDIVKSKGYEPVLYPVNDENELGFFTSATKVIDPVTNNYYRDVVYLNRFNPALPTIDYYLSDNFFEPENKIFLDATIETVVKMNETLSLDKTGVPSIRIANPVAPKGVHPGDLRYNVINLVDEPLANGLLGYGPSVAHPLTGEIVKAHVNQYSGVARTGVKVYWDNMARVYNRGELSKALTDVTHDHNSSEVREKAASQTMRVAMANVQRLVEDVDAPALSENYYQIPTHESGPSRPTELLSDMAFEDLAKAEQQRMAFWAENNLYPLEASWSSATTKSEIERLPLSDDRFFNIVLDDKGVELTRTLRYWHELPEDVLQDVSDAITVTTYSNTFVHEIGHNLGLRHNFKASNDKANFFTDDQVDKLKLNVRPAYSSTMDYAPSMLDETPTWGLYDLAAFKFGYGRKVDVISTATFSERDENGDFIHQGLLNCFENSASNSENPDAEVTYTCDVSAVDAQVNKDYFARSGEGRYGVLRYIRDLGSSNDSSFGFETSRKPYSFCTDGNVSGNSDCNRFDEGTNRPEIIDYYWQSYLDSFDRRNAAVYREGVLFKNDYSSYALRRHREFNEVREFIEEAEMIDDLFEAYGENQATDKPLDHLARLTTSACVDSEGYSADTAWYCDYGLPVERAASFFLDVLATPEHQCLVQLGDSPDASRFMVSLEQTFNRLSHLVPANYQVGFASCFDEEIKSLFTGTYGSVAKVVAETRDGKFLNSTRSVNPDVPYSDAVSVLGMWPDKVIAADMLMRRETLRWTDDGNHSALIDWPGVKPEFDNVIEHILTGAPLARTITLVNEQGVDVTKDYNVSVNLHVTELLESLAPMNRAQSNYLGLDFDKRQTFAELILARAARSVHTDDFELAERARVQRDSFIKYSGGQNDLANGVLEFNVGGRVFEATGTNTLAQKYASTLVDKSGQNTKAILDATERALISKVFEDRTRAYGKVLSLPSSQWVMVESNGAPYNDGPFVNSIIAFIPDSLTEMPFTNDLANNVINVYLGTAIEQGFAVLDNNNGTISFAGGTAYPIQTAVNYTYQIIADVWFGNAQHISDAISAYPAAYAAATSEEKLLWDMSYLQLQAYLNGSYDTFEEQYHKVLSQLPTY